MLYSNVHMNLILQNFYRTPRSLAYKISPREVTRFKTQTKVYTNKLN